MHDTLIQVFLEIKETVAQSRIPTCMLNKEHQVKFGNSSRKSCSMTLINSLSYLKLVEAALFFFFFRNYANNVVLCIPNDW